MSTAVTSVGDGSGGASGTGVTTRTRRDGCATAEARDELLLREEEDLADFFGGSGTSGAPEIADATTSAFALRWKDSATTKATIAMTGTAAMASVEGDGRCMDRCLDGQPPKF